LQNIVFFAINLCKVWMCWEVVLTQLDGKQKNEHGWNKRHNKKAWGLYVCVGLLCVALAWLLGGAG